MASPTRSPHSHEVEFPHNETHSFFVQLQKFPEDVEERQTDQPSESKVNPSGEGEDRDKRRTEQNRRSQFYAWLVQCVGVCGVQVVYMCVGYNMLTFKESVDPLAPPQASTEQPVADRTLRTMSYHERI